ncbi:MlaD family protein [Nocardia ninae]|uniref:Putative Mce family protein n=1 Tax=Nocardia ninae NBRC 108245 TaxID=1210091 RepID=A0A511ME77_9NOCA|nr:MlaD family protein [Nocardia ninae]GEM38932.1 putative Mce family protein [Nocardia ninae NBRC 108245]
MKRLIPVLAAMVLVLTGCGVRATDVPIPGTYLAGDTFSIRIEFGSVLNLPDRAKIIAEGVEVGMLDRIELIGDTAVATVDLKADVRLPKSTTAELRQSTILGDIHIALQAPSNAGPPFLVNGDVIPRSRTVPAANVEDILRAMSNIVTGGRFGEMQELVASVNAAFPTDPVDLSRILAGGRNALHDLATHTSELDRILAAAASVTTTLEANKDNVDRTLTLGPGRAAGLSEVLFGLVQLIIDGGELATYVGDLALPLRGDLHDIISILAPAARTIGSADTTVPMNVAAMNRLLRDKLIPFFSAPPNIRVQRVTPEAVAADASARSDEMIQVLRSIGMVR